MLRSLGIPARFSCGVAALPDGNFYYHEWVEAWTGAWVSLDPSFNQVIVDPGHITLFRGETSDLLGIVNILGNIQITPMTNTGEIP